jgi:hypothetical protein
MFMGVGGEKKHADEYQNRQQSAFHQVSRIVSFGQLRKVEPVIISTPKMEPELR